MLKNATITWFQATRAACCSCKHSGAAAPTNKVQAVLGQGSIHVIFNSHHFFIGWVAAKLNIAFQAEMNLVHKNSGLHAPAKEMVMLPVQDPHN